MQSTQNILKVSLLFAALFILAGCGTSKTSNDGFDSASTTTSASTSTSTDAIATCSKDIGNLSDFSVRIQQYKDAYGVVRPEYARILITKAPADFKTQGWKLYMYRWAAIGSTISTIDATADRLNYQFERNLSPSFPQILPEGSAEYYRFNGGQILGDGTTSNPGLVPYANQNSLYPKIDGTSATTFFSGVTLRVALRDSTNSFQVVRLVLRDSSGTDVRTLDVLIPSFKADPNLYNQETYAVNGSSVLRHPTALQNLHPLKNLVGQTGIAQTYFYEAARAFCF